MNIRIRFGIAFVCALVLILFSCNSVPPMTERTQSALPPTTASSSTPTHIEETGPLNPIDQPLEKPTVAPTVDISTMSINLKQELYFVWGAEGGPLSTGTGVLFEKYNVSQESISRFLEDGTTPPELLDVQISPFFTAFFDTPSGDKINLCIYGVPEDETITIELYTPEDTLCVSQDIRVSDYYYLTVGEITEVDFSMDLPRGSHAGQWSVVVKSATIGAQQQSLEISWYQMARFSVSHFCDSPDGYISVQGIGYPPEESRLLGVYGSCFDSEKDMATICKLLESYLVKTGSDGSFDILLPSNLSGKYIAIPVLADVPPHIGGDVGYNTLNPEVSDYPELCRYHRELYLTTPALKGGDVRAVQQRLMDLGYSEVGEVDGYYNSQTESAIVLFQKMNGLSQSGIVDEQTLDAMLSNDARSAAAHTAKPTADTLKPPTCTNAGATWVRSTDEMIFVCVPSGTFQMGSTDVEVNDAWELCNEVYGNCERAWFEREQPIHTVTLDGFWLDRTEVTNKQYAKCVANGACTISTYANDANFNGEQQPVVGVDWYNATAYCAWAGGQLPTEAQWEYAARGPGGHIFPWGNTISYGAELNCCDKNCTERWSDKFVDEGYLYPAPVGSFLRGESWAGALDMAGNVMEWTADRYGNYFSGAQVNPEGPATGDTRVGRGGSWHGMMTNVRSAYRNGYEPTLTNDNLGFRCMIGSAQGQ